MTDVKKYNQLLIMLIISAMMVFGLSRVIDNSANAAYIESFIGCIFSLIVYTVIYNHNAVKNLLKSDGLIGKIICLITVFSFVLYASSFTAYLTSSVNKFFMHKSPVPYLAFFCIVPAAFGGYFGIKSVSRYASVIWITLLAATSVILILCSGDYNTDNLFPLLGNGVSRIAMGSANISLYGVILVYYVCVRDEIVTNRQIKKQIAKIILISGTFGTAVCLAVNLLLPYQAVTYAQNPYLTIASSVKMNFLLERSEIIVLVLWIFSAFLCVSALCAGVFSISEKMMKIKDKRGIIGAVIFIIYVLTVLIDCIGRTEMCISISSYLLSGLSIVIPIAALIRKGVKND